MPIEFKTLSLKNFIGDLPNILNEDLDLLNEKLNSIDSSIAAMSNANAYTLYNKFVSLINTYDSSLRTLISSYDTSINALNTEINSLQTAIATITAVQSTDITASTFDTISKNGTIGFTSISTQILKSQIVDFWNINGTTEYHILARCTSVTYNSGTYTGTCNIVYSYITSTTL